MAKDDLKNLYWQGMDMFGPAQADRYIDGMLHTLDLLADFPRMGRFRPEFSPQGYAYAYKSHVILYRLDDSGDVRVQRIRHGLEDWQGDLPSDGEMDWK